LFGLALAIPTGLLATNVLGERPLTYWIVAVVGLWSVVHFLDTIIDHRAKHVVTLRDTRLGTYQALQRTLEPYTVCWYDPTPVL
jgi:hypothetical protein